MLRTISQMEQNKFRLGSCEVGMYDPLHEVDDQPMQKAEEVGIEKADNTTEDDIEKSDLMNAISSHGNEIKSSKTASEIKSQLESVVIPAFTSDVAIAKTAADTELAECGKAPLKEVPEYWLEGMKIDCGYKIYDWGEICLPCKSENSMMQTFSASDAEEKKQEQNIPENEAQSKSRDKYNDCVRNICMGVLDLKACEILLALVGEGNKTFDLTPRQMLALRFV